MNTELVAKLVELRKYKAHYSAQLDRIKEAEKKLTSEIISEMQASKVDAVRSSGYTVSATSKDRFEVADQSKFLRVVLKDLNTAQEAGQDLGTACLLQKTPAKLLLKDLIEQELESNGVSAENHDAEFVRKAEEWGLKYVVTPALYVSQSK